MAADRHRWRRPHTRWRSRVTGVLFTGSYALRTLRIAHTIRVVRSPQ